MREPVYALNNLIYIFQPLIIISNPMNPIIVGVVFLFLINNNFILVL